MVKADLTRDYYGDLEIAPGAELNEIKKQFKKLALTYHPDRNPGRESEVTAKFQKIQSAHEVLIDPQERAKYDANRIRGGGRFGGMSSGVRGNPWANATAAYPPPPKAPTARNRPPPPPSTGARRYEKFATPNSSAYQASQEGPQARKDTYEAWEKVRHAKPTPGDGSTPGPGKSWKAPQPPPRGTPQSGREESNARRHPPPPRAAPGFEEFREANSSPRRSQSTNNANRKSGFMPATPGGGDEPPAPMGAYFTERNKPNTAPEVPPREPQAVPRERPQASRPPISNPLRQFQDSPMGSEDRISTPYATHGGEKLNPFDSANMNRSKSTRERPDRFDDTFIPRSGSDSNLKSPLRQQRARSFAQRSSPREAKQAFTETINLDPSSEESSSDGFVQMNARSRVPRTNGANGTPNGASNGGTPTTGQNASGNLDTSKQDEDLLGWLNRRAMDSQGGSNTPSDGHSKRPQTQPRPQSGQPNGESMYANSNYSNSVTSDRRGVPNFSVKLPTVAETISSDEQWAPKRSPDEYFTPGAQPKTPTAPSGVSAAPAPQSLNAFEDYQRSLVDQLLTNKKSGGSGKKSHTFPVTAPPWGKKSVSTESAFGVSKQGSALDSHYPQNNPAWTEYRDSSLPTSPSKKPKPVKHLHTVHPFDYERSHHFWEEFKKKKAQANYPDRSSSFSFNINDETFSRTRHQSNGFSNSAENISTKFTPEDWDGKFEAGAEYFKPDAKRTQSTSRPRGRSPVKTRPVDGKFAQARVESETPMPMESPGGTKFSAEEWNETFKPQTFMPNTMPPPPRTATTPSRKRTGPRPTMGTAAVVDDSETSDDKPLFNGRKNMYSKTSSPEPMDVDTPPAQNTVPQYATTPNGHLKVSTEPLKRAASKSASASPTDTASLKVNFDDLKIQDLMSTLALPTPPEPPRLPVSESEYERPTPQAYTDYIKRYEKYMGEWDIFNSKYLLHMVARRRQNDGLKEKRWTDEQGIEMYRLGLKEDQAVLKKWGEMVDMHEFVVKTFVLVRERMKSREEREGGVGLGSSGGGGSDRERARPRKKTH